MRPPSRCRLGLTPSEPLCGLKDPFPSRLTYCWRKARFLTCYWPEPPSLSWVSPRAAHGAKVGFPHGEGFRKQRHQRQNHRIFHKLTLEVTCHCFCHIPLVTKTSTTWEGTTQPHQHREERVTEHHRELDTRTRNFFLIILLVHDIKDLETTVVNRM